MKIFKADIGNYIPQRAPFIMIDNLVYAGDDYFESDFFIHSGNIFVDNGKFREYGLVESIAQCSSAGLAFSSTKLQGKTIEGFIGAISKLKLHQLPAQGQTIKTRVHLLAQLDNMYLVKGQAFINETILLECELKLAGK